MNNPKFVVELIPKTSFYTNVRSQVSTEAWDWLRKETYKQAGHRCEGCGAKGRMEAHEIWHFDDQNHIQKLDSIACYCHTCHMCHHLGFAELNGELPKVKKHLAKINKWTTEEVNLFVECVFDVWFHRSKHKWNIDLSLLDKCNIPYKKIV